jgi:hypothetical protein
MNARLLFVLLFVLLDSVACIELRAKQQGVDHLTPFKPSVYDELRPSLYRKLCVTQATHGRMIELPAGPERGEWAVSLHCSEGSASDQVCFVTLTRATANLDYIMQKYRGKDPLKVVNRVRVVRKDAPIQQSVASAIRSAWLKFLQRVKSSPIRPNDPIPLDAEKIEFWIQNNNRTTLKGEVPDNAGKTVTAFVELGRLLGNYCEVPERQRPDVVAKIELDAKRLVARIPN